MTGLTTNEFLPYPLETDYADVQDVYDLAIKVDADMRAYDAAFTGGPRPLSFVWRNSAAGSSFVSGTQGITFDVIEFDNTGSTVAGGSWFQPHSDPQSWWLFGCNILTAPVAGSPATTDHMEAQLQISSTDPISGATTTTNYYNKKVESISGGEHTVVVAVAPVYLAIVSGNLVYQSTSAATRQFTAGCRLWGMRLGAA